MPVRESGHTSDTSMNVSTRLKMTDVLQSW
jgi:hypothetical protein